MTDTVSKIEFRDAMARICTPVNIITTDGKAGRGGFTATAVCSVTDEPPTVLVCMNAGSAQVETFKANGRFCVNVLTNDHTGLASGFAGGIREMEERYAAAHWVTMDSGALALDDAIVSLDCETADIHRVGTHNVMIGRVTALRLGAAKGPNPLLYMDRTYMVPAQAGSFGG
ncbi:flavin reductase [Aurantimonas sp. VKM B-3413]|uniref:flavin reductase n=1 Tax=Aurantimonas sp. VKM B-3413 TaxID=2779401 RepID=UPI001E5D783B|nr:flavin reductase [Aurantimonas sp. VKM B-3413]MCB8836293.1 flavin reductase [Aurantimonas sp. VKM B-3413]